MAPTTGADPSTPGFGPSSDEHALAPLAPAGFPLPAELADQLKQRIDTLLIAARKGRTVTCPEDTHAAIRQLADWHSRATDYAGAFNTVKTYVEGYAEEELLDAVGPRKGTVDTPARAMNVPADGMNIALVPQWDTDRDIDMRQVLNALAVETADGWGACETAETTWTTAIAMAVEVAELAVGLYCKTSPSVKAVQAFAAEAGARGHDDVAATVNSAIRETVRKYRKTRLEVKPAA